MEGVVEWRSGRGVGEEKTHIHQDVAEMFSAHPVLAPDVRAL